MAARQPPEASAAAGSIEEIGSRGGVQEDAASSSREEAIADVSGNSWEVSLLERQLPDRAAEGLYVFHNTFHLLPRGIGRLGALKTLKLFSNDIEVLPPEVVDLVELERLQLKISSPQISGLSLQKLKSLTELELSKTPPRLSASSILSEISGLKCLTRLSICHFSIRFLPPEVSNLKKLQELDISFNKLKNLPDGIAELSSLKSLNVANNKLVDPPPCISLMSNLERLDLSNNKLTSLTSLRLSSMLTLQHLNLEHNNLPYGFAIPYWVRCKFEGNTQGNIKFQTSSNASEVYDPAIHRTHLSRYCNGCHSTSSCSHLELSNSIRCHVARRMKRRGWNRQIYIQQRGRQERLNYSRKCKGEDPNRSMNLKMVEEADISSFIEPVTAAVFKESAKEDVFHNDDASAVNSDGCCLAKESESNEVGLLESHPEEQSSCATYNSNCVNKDNDFESEREDNGFSFHSISSFDVSDEQSSCETPNVTSKSKRHSEKDLDNPKPSKFRKPVEDCSDLSCKYSIESYCSIDDFIPDGFYDAGRNRPFKSLLDFEQSLCLDSREVILLDREKDEELDAIVFSAQLLMSRLKRSSLSGREDNIVDDLYRASILALFVSDCFGGSERSGSIMKMRRSLLGSRKQQPFVCTCSAGYNFEKTRLLENKRDNEVNVNFSELCDNSLQVIKKSRNSNIVPIGTLRFGVCRHRAVLMKYLCDRVDPPIPCELIRGYLDFMPHAWNTVCVRRGNSCVRMVVDACYPTDIREETDLEYFCRYVPLSRFLVPLETGNSTVPTLSIPFSLNYQIKSTSRSIIHCKFGTLDAAIKVRYLIAEQTSIEEIRAFEHMLLGEVRILGALRNHKHIVHIHGHQLSCKWLPAEDGNKDHRLLQSMIIMEHVNGGSLKSYLDRLKEKGRKHAPVDIALCIARDVACALVEVHSKQIIHRDIKSENILVDFASRSDTVPAVKLCDFDRSVPLHCSAHTCCIAHLGIHPPNVCVGTPRWMAPEVVQAMHQKQSYGLEVDIWSYGCLLLELLTLELPYQGLSESELYKLLQMQQRPMLTPELEALTVASQDETTAQSKTTAFSSNAEAEILKCLVDLFFQCTHGDPSHRPSAKHIYDSLLSISSRLETADHDTVGSD